jgi:hypothetical protein
LTPGTEQDVELTGSAGPDEGVVWAMLGTLAVVVFVAVGLGLSAMRPSPESVDEAINDSNANMNQAIVCLQKGIPAERCPNTAGRDTTGPWYAQHAWVVAAFAALIAVVLARLFVFMHRLENRSA